MLKKFLAVLICTISLISVSYGEAGSKIESGGIGKDVSNSNMASHAYSNSKEPAEGWQPQNFNSFVSESRKTKGKQIEDLKFKMDDMLFVDGKWEVEYWDDETYFEYQYVDGSTYGDIFELDYYYLVNDNGVLKKPYGSMVSKSDYPAPYRLVEQNAKSQLSTYSSILKQGKVIGREDITFKSTETNRQYHITDSDVYIALKIGYRSNEDLKPKGDYIEWFYGKYEIRLIKLGRPAEGVNFAQDTSEAEDTVSTYDGVQEFLKRKNPDVPLGTYSTQLNYQDYPEYPWTYKLRGSTYMDVKENQVALAQNHTLFIRQGNLYAFGEADRGFYEGFEDYSYHSYRHFNKNEKYVYPILVDKDVVNVTVSSEDPLRPSVFYIKKDGSLWGFGSNKYGQLGDGSFVDRLRPVKIMDDVVQVTADSDQTLAIKKDGSLWIWGSTNYFFDMDRKFALKRERPLPYRIFDDVIDVDHRRGATLVLKSDGVVYAWGEKIKSTGDRDLKDVLWSEYVLTLENVRSIDAGRIVSSVITKDNKLWLIGQFDNETLDSYYYENEQLAPNVRLFMENIKSADVEEHLLAYVKEDDTLWTWGYAAYVNIWREMFPFTGTFSDWHKEPKKLLDDVDQMYRQNNHNFVFLKDGSVWCWGDTTNGELRPNNLASELISMDCEMTPVRFDYQYIDASKNNRLFKPMMVDNSITRDSDGSYKDILEGRYVDINLKVEDITNTVGVYQVNQEYFVNLRDIGYFLKDSNKSVKIDWNKEKNEIKLLTHQAYNTLGTELRRGDYYYRNGEFYSSKLLVDGVEEELLTYTFHTAIYTRLTHIAEVLGLDVSVEVINIE